MSQASPQGWKRTLAAIAGLAFITILSLGFVAYAVMNPHVMTVTQQQLLTNTQSQFVTQTVTNVNTVTTYSTMTATSTSAYAINTVVGYAGPSSSTCGPYGCSPPSLGAYGNLCQSTGENNTMQCSGYLSEPGDGCTQLAIPYTNPALLESTAYQFYALRNAPSNLPSPGTWITVTGVLGQGYTPGSNGAACPSSYINVNSVTP